MKAGGRLNWARRVVLCSLFLCALGLVGCRREPALSVTQGKAMGTTWKLVIRSADRDAAEYFPEIAALLEEQEERFSNWREESEVSQLERGEVTESAEMRRLLALCESVTAESGGAFNISWNGGLDLGGVAKGWAVDRVGEVLLRQGVENFVFELGGEVVARGQGGEVEGWEVQIEAPAPLSAKTARTVTLCDEALATSGNYHQPKHLKDGRSGVVVGGPFRSVTVVMPTCAEADAWATALFVSGENSSGGVGEVYWNKLE